MTARQISDYTGAAALLDDLLKAQWLLGDRLFRHRSRCNLHLLVMTNEI